jgi:transcriptional regulator with XRE-family HTH domain
MSRTTFSSYERDTQRPSVDVLPAIADFLGISIDDVLVLFGASAISAARAALGRLNSAASASANSSPSNTDIHTSDVPMSSDAIEASSHFDGSYASVDGDIQDHNAVVSSPYNPVMMSIDAESGTRVKVHDEVDKGKKKKKKKSKREKLVNPSFASHV